MTRYHRLDNGFLYSDTRRLGACVTVDIRHLGACMPIIHIYVSARDPSSQTLSPKDQHILYYISTQYCYYPIDMSTSNPYTYQ